MNKLLSGRHVLVVEDEMMILMFMEDMLADLGCESVTAAATVDQALALIDEQNFDAVLLDMNLNGNKTCLIADKLAACGTPFVFCTGNDHTIWKDHCDRAILRKPFKYEELEKILPHLSFPPIKGRA